MRNRNADGRSFVLGDERTIGRNVREIEIQFAAVLIGPAATREICDVIRGGRND
jgi:predicted component of type VI protein secretion system